MDEIRSARRSPWWNPASKERAIHCTHGIGQDKNVMVYLLSILDYGFLNTE